MQVLIFTCGWKLRCYFHLPAGGLAALADEGPVDALLGHQLFMGAPLDDFAVIDHQDLVGVLHGLQPVGDHDDGLLPGQRLDGLRQLVLVLRVHVGGGLVQEDHRRVLHHGPGDGDALALAAGQVRAALADHGVVAVGQRRDEVVAAGLLRRGDHVLHRRVGRAEADVVGDGVAEQVDVLEHEGEVLHQAVHVVVPHVAPAQGHRPGVRVPEPGQQVDQRGLAAAGGADDGGGGPFGDVQRYAVDDLLFVIGELQPPSPRCPGLRVESLPRRCPSAARPGSPAPGPRSCPPRARAPSSCPRSPGSRRR